MVNDKEVEKKGKNSVSFFDNFWLAIGKYARVFS
jgi:hypothetical protein